MKRVFIVFIENVANIMLNNTPLPFVESCKHLGLNLFCDNTLDRDCDIKSGKVHSLLQELYFASSDVLLKVLNVYCTSFFGSNCWNLFSNNCDRFYKAWNVACRIMLKISNLSHRYLIEPLTECLHPKVIMCSRFVQFKQSLLNSNKSLVRLLANLNENNCKTTFGSNLQKIALLCKVNVESLDPTVVKSKMEYFPLPINETWRIPLINELLAIKTQKCELPGFSIEEVNDMLVYACTS